MKEPNKICATCGKSFYRPKCLDRIKYCSKECYWKGRKNKKIPEEWRRNISKGVKNNLPRTAWKKGERFSPETEFKKNELLEKEHPKWVNGISTYRKIFERNNRKFVCEKCGESKKRILIHHIDGNRKNNDNNNLMPLCDKCHGKTHWKFNHIKICEWCNKKFETYKNEQRFCSISCGLKNRHDKNAN